MEEIKEKVSEHKRLSKGDGIFLFSTDDIHGLGKIANSLRERLYGNKAYYIKNLHINYTNVCVRRCRFCAFYSKPTGPTAYTMSSEEIYENVLKYKGTGIKEVHIVGGVHPGLEYKYYLDICRAVKKAAPDIHLKAFTMIELAQIHDKSKKSIQDVLHELKESGLDMMPGGGAEVFSERLHEKLFKNKLGSNEWLTLAEESHKSGFKTNATMLYGHIETIEEKVCHLMKLRELQDRTGGFLSFIPLAFHPENTELSYLQGTTGLQDLRHIAVSRLMLDNFPHIKTYWIMVTPSVSQLCLNYGADDIDGTIIEEKITHAAGGKTPKGLSEETLKNLIKEAGRVPVERNALYISVANN